MTRRRTALALLVLLALVTPTLRAADEPNHDRKVDVVYGRKYGTALTMDVFTPKENAQGIGVILVVSGGWFSAHEAIAEPLVKPLVDRGYTVFAVVHGSQPRYTIPEILVDMHRAVRYIRHHAKDYGIDPDHLGIYGGSAGGHLSLMQGTAGTEGQSDAKDPVDRESSRVQAVACFFPPTDFLNYGQEGHNALGTGILENFKAPFDFHELDRERRVFVPIVDHARRHEIGRAISPYYHASSDDPPTLIIHGDADKLVPIQQSERMVEALKKEGVEAVLVVHEGGAHGWPNWQADVARFVDWFDAHLKPAKDE